MQRSEAGLAVLVLRQVVVRLEQLQPAAGLDLLLAARVEDVVVEGEQVARGGVVRAHVGARGGDQTKRRSKRSSRRSRRHPSACPAGRSA